MGAGPEPAQRSEAYVEMAATPFDRFLSTSSLVTYLALSLRYPAAAGLTCPVDTMRRAMAADRHST